MKHTFKILVLSTLFLQNISYSNDPWTVHKAVPKEVSGEQKSATQKSVLEGYDALDARIFLTYVQKCAEKVKEFASFKEEFNKTATCGFASTYGVHLKSKVEGDTVIIESNIWGDRPEFEQAQQNTSSHEQNTLKGTFLQELTHKKNKSTMIKTGHTKCGAPEYYDGDRGLVKCHTLIALEEFKKLKDKILS